MVPLGLSDRALWLCVVVAGQDPPPPSPEQGIEWLVEWGRPVGQRPHGQQQLEQWQRSDTHRHGDPACAMLWMESSIMHTLAHPRDGRSTRPMLG